MTAEYEEKEREFLANLEADTGRDLAAWMEALTREGLADRNARIDWLRHQGFIFSWASWLERIHHNGGRPIYLKDVPESAPAPGLPTARRPLDARRDPDPAAPANAPAGVPTRAPGDGATPLRPAAPPAAEARRSAEPPATPPATTEPRADAPTTPAPRPAGTSPRAFDPFAALPSGTIKTDDQETLARTVASAKAYAPLMTFLLGQIAQRLPDAFAVPARDHVLLTVSKRKSAPFALIAVTQTELRLGLQLGSWPVKPPMEKARFAGGAAKAGRDLTHMIALTDARQIEAGLVNLIEAAHTRARQR